jgi:two-component system chemotaxis response regulator CheY
MGKLILTVDDSPSIRLMMKLTLTGEGYEVVQATDGVEALKWARQQVADLVLTDVNMPQMDGLTLIKELRALPGYKSVPMLILRRNPAWTESRSASRTEQPDGW